MTDIDIKALRESDAKRTPGDWEADGDGPGCILEDQFSGHSIRCETATKEETILDDYAHICVAVNALPALLDELERLRRLATEALSALCGDCADGDEPWCDLEYDGSWIHGSGEAGDRNECGAGFIHDVLAALNPTTDGEG